MAKDRTQGLVAGKVHKAVLWTYFLDTLDILRGPTGAPSDTSSHGGISLCKQLLCEGRATAVQWFGKSFLWEARVPKTVFGMQSFRHFSRSFLVSHLWRGWSDTNGTCRCQQNKASRQPPIWAASQSNRAVLEWPSCPESILWVVHAKVSKMVCIVASG